MGCWGSSVLATRSNLAMHPFCSNWLSSSVAQSSNVWGMWFGSSMGVRSEPLKRRPWKRPSLQDRQIHAIVPLGSSQGSGSCRDGLLGLFLLKIWSVSELFPVRNPSRAREALWREFFLGSRGFLQRTLSCLRRSPPGSLCRL